MLLFLLTACGDPPGPKDPEDRLELGEVTAVAHAERVTEVTVTASPSEPVALAVRCEADDDPEEAHLGRTETGALTFYGLLPGTAYTCTVTTEDGRRSASAGVTTGRWADPPEVVVEGDASAMDGAYTLFNVGNVCGAPGPGSVWVADPDGNLRWRFVVPEDVVVDVVATYLGEGRFLIGGGAGLVGLGDSSIREVGLDGTVSVFRTEPVSGTEFNHHVEQLPTGEHLSIVWRDNTGDRGDFVGFGIERYDPAAATATFDWSSQLAVDAGSLPDGGGGSDAFHANAVQYVPDDPAGPSFWVSLATLDALVRVDEATGAVTDAIGPGTGWTLHDLEGKPTDDQWWSFQHALRVTPQADGTLVMTLHDNGHVREKSRLLDLLVDPEARTVRVTWDWSEDGWYEYVGGDHDVLPSGHRLATQGHAACFGGVDRQSTITEVDPADGSVVWRLTLPGEYDYPYRADRIDGCALFANRKYCPELDG